MFVPCGEATVIGQVIESPEAMTFRSWNSEKLNLPYGQNTGIKHEYNWCTC